MLKCLVCVSLLGAAAGCGSDVSSLLSASPAPTSSNPLRAAATPATAGTLSAKYRDDVGIGADPSVMLYENFEAGSVARILTRYDSYSNPAGMMLVPDHPPNSPGRYAIRFTAGGNNPGTHLYKSFGAGYEELYVRYYIKYIGSGPWHHSGVWIGGYNPPLRHPNPRAGLRPAGDDLYSIGLEPVSAANTPIDLYAYWMGMRSWRAAPTPTPARGDNWGNTLLHNAEFQLQSDTWVCYELHLKLNPDALSSTGAVLEVWQDDRLIRRFDDSGPLGYWIRDKFCPDDADGVECTAYRPANPALALLDQQWRSTRALKINYFWPQNYNTARTSSSLLLDDMVVATRRIGCTVRP
jgi:hypothetical protein